MLDSADSGSRDRACSTIWDRHAVINALHFLGPRRTEFLGEISALLNEYHQLDFQQDYYDFLCGEWLLHFTDVVYAAYLEVKSGNAISSERHAAFVCADFMDYQQTIIKNSDFSAQLRREVSRRIGTATYEKLVFSSKPVQVGRASQSLRQQLKLRAEKLKTSLLSTSCSPFLFCQPYLKCSRLDWSATLFKWRRWARQDNFDYPVYTTVEIDAEWRESHSADITVSSFQDLIRSLLPIYIPVAYLEAFSTYRQKAHALGLNRPKAIYTAIGLHGNTLFKTLAADWRREGTKIINHQHGGCYGIDKIHSAEEYETRVADQFLTWGWTGNSPKQTPLPPAFSESQFRGVKMNQRIVLACMLNPKEVYRVQFQPMPGTIETMISETAAFVRETRAWPQFFVRVFPEHYGWDMLATLRKANPSFLLDDLGMSGLASYQRATLVVHGYLGTSWLETLALNIPTVCFYDPEIYDFRNRAKYFIDMFESVGVLHRRGATAAKFVSGIMCDPQGWWQLPEIQNLRENFVKNYANFSTNWSPLWEAEFKKWID